MENEYFFDKRLMISIFMSPLNVHANWFPVDGKVKNVTETTYSFATAGYSVEEEGGDFAIHVTAVPAADDYTRVESQPAELSFHVNDVPEEPGVKIVTYDLVFPTPEAEQKVTDAKFVCENNDGFYVSTTGEWKYDANSQKFAVSAEDAEPVQYTSRLKGGKTSDSKTMTITVPNDGTLYIAARSGNGSATDRTMKLMQGEKVVFEETVIKDADKFSTGAFPFVVVDVKAGDIQVILNNGINFYGIRYDAIEGSAAEPVSKVWDFSAAEWIEAMTATGYPAGDKNNTTLDIEVDGLKVVAGGSSMIWNKSGDTYFWQPGGKSDGTTRYFEFTAEVAGKLTVYATNTGSSEDLTRMVTVKVGDGEPESLPGGYSSSNGPVAVDFNITPGVVKIYPTGNGLRFYKIEYHSN